jgi:hypothetical protein
MLAELTIGEAKPEGLSFSVEASLPGNRNGK